MSIYNFVTKRYDKEDDVNGFIPLVFPSDRASTLRRRFFAGKPLIFRILPAILKNSRDAPDRSPTPSAAAAPPEGETSIEKKGK